MDEEPDLDARDDLVLLLEACAARLDEEVLTRVRAEVGADVRFRDGYVFQHLVAGACSVTELARQLGVTQQAASKQVADLVARRLVVSRKDPVDGRARLVSLSARGRRAVEAGRRARRAIADEAASGLGEANVGALVEHLRALSDHTGAIEYLLARRVRPEEAR